MKWLDRIEGVTYHVESPALHAAGGEVHVLIAALFLLDILDRFF